MPKIGRPKKPRAIRLAATVSFRVSDAERKAIAAGAARAKKKPGAWAKEQTLAATVDA